MNQRFLIIIFLSLFVASTFFLFSRNVSELDPDNGKSWWTLSFTSLENPRSLDFIVENFSDNTRFEYEVVADKETLAKDSFELNRGEKKTVTPNITARPDTRTSIIVTTRKEKKEIYR